MQQHRPMQKPPSDTPLPPTRTLPATPPAPWWGIPALRHMRADYLGFVTTLQQRHGELRRANEILKLASAFFAQAELDRRLKS